MALGQGTAADRIFGRHIRAALVFAADVCDTEGDGTFYGTLFPLSLERGRGGKHEAIAALHEHARAAGQDELPRGKLSAVAVHGGRGHVCVQIGKAAGGGRLTALDPERDAVAAVEERRVAERGGKLAGRIAQRDLLGGRDGIERDGENVTLAAAVEDRPDGGGVKVLGKDRRGERDGSAAVHSGLGELEQALAALVRRGAVRNDHKRTDGAARGRRDLHAVPAQIGDRGGRDRRVVFVLAPVESKAGAERVCKRFGVGEGPLVPFGVLCADRPDDGGIPARGAFREDISRRTDKLQHEKETEQKRNGFGHVTHIRFTSKRKS